MRTSTTCSTKNAFSRRRFLSEEAVLLTFHFQRFLTVTMKLLYHILNPCQDCFFRITSFLIFLYKFIVFNRFLKKWALSIYFTSFLSIANIVFIFFLVALLLYMTPHITNFFLAANQMKKFFIQFVSIFYGFYLFLFNSAKFHKYLLFSLLFFQFIAILKNSVFSIVLSHCQRHKYCKKAERKNDVCVVTCQKIQFIFHSATKKSERNITNGTFKI